MKRFLVAFGLSVGLLWSASAAAAHTTVWWAQDFSVGTGGWYDSSSTPTWFGAITHNAASETATVTGGTINLGPYSTFDQYRDEWPGDYVAEIKVYLDPTWPVGTGFDYNVATTGFRYSAVQVAVDADGLWIGASDESSYVVRPRTANAQNVTAAGWYTIQQLFRDVGGVLTVTVTVTNSTGAVVLTDTFADPSDQLTGNGPSWFTFITVPGGVEIDDHRLAPYTPPPTGPQNKDECKKNGWTQFGFKNQGQCVSSVQASPNAMK